MADPEAILDAAGRLFAQHGVGGVEMKDIAAAAGCSRATLYRCFENREALHTAYVHREARAVGRALADFAAPIPDPQRRLLAVLTEALRLVRRSDALSAWFSHTTIGARAAAGSDVVAAMTAAFLSSVGVADEQRRARWLVRVLVSLLITPGRDEADERDMLAEFVIPVLAPAGEAVRR